jgi:hypothetical protein
MLRWPHGHRIKVGHQRKNPASARPDNENGSDLRRDGGLTWVKRADNS